MRRLLPALLATTLLLSACGFLIDSNPSPVDQCGWMTDGSVSTVGKPVRAILLDRSNSTRAADATAPDYVSSLDPAVRELVDTGAAVSIGTFDGSGTTVHWTGQPMATDKLRQNPGNRADDATDARNCLSDALARAGADAPEQPGTDVVGAVKVAVDQRLGAAPDRGVVIATDGLTNVGCADLTNASIGDERAIPQIVSRCQSLGDLPEKLRGVGITMVGIGHPAGSLPQPATNQLFWLQRLWTALLCTDDPGAGGLPATCVISVDSVPAAPAGSRAPATAVNDAVLDFPPPPGGVTRIPVDSRVLFGRNSDIITAQGTNALRMIAASIRSLGPAAVTVEGYTEAQSTPEDNLGLATRRAAAVTAVLAAEQITATPHGNAGVAPGCGTSDSDIDRQCTRRVDIVVSPT